MGPLSNCWDVNLHHPPDLPGLRLVLCIQLPVLLIGQLRGILVVQGLLHGELDQQSDAVRPAPRSGGGPSHPAQSARKPGGRPPTVLRNLEGKGPAQNINAGQHIDKKLHTLNGFE